MIAVSGCILQERPKFDSCTKAMVTVIIKKYQYQHAKVKTEKRDGYEKKTNCMGNFARIAWRNDFAGGIHGSKKSGAK